MADGKLLRRIRNHPLILPVYLPSFIGAICNGLLIPILPLYILSFDVSYGVVGLFLASNGIGMLVSDIPVLARQPLLRDRLSTMTSPLLSVTLCFATVALCPVSLLSITHCLATRILAPCNQEITASSSLRPTLDRVPLKR